MTTNHPPEPSRVTDDDVVEVLADIAALVTDLTRHYTDEELDERRRRVERRIPQWQPPPAASSGRQPAVTAMQESPIASRAAGADEHPGRASATEACAWWDVRDRASLQMLANARSEADTATVQDFALSPSSHTVRTAGTDNTPRAVLVQAQSVLGAALAGAATSRGEITAAVVRQLRPVVRPAVGHIRHGRRPGSAGIGAAAVRTMADSRTAFGRYLLPPALWRVEWIPAALVPLMSGVIGVADPGPAAMASLCDADCDNAAGRTPSRCPPQAWCRCSAELLHDDPLLASFAATHPNFREVLRELDEKRRAACTCSTVAPAGPAVPQWLPESLVAGRTVESAGPR